MRNLKEDCSLQRYFNVELIDGRLVFKNSNLKTCRGNCQQCHRCRWL